MKWLEIRQTGTGLYRVHVFNPQLVRVFIPIGRRNVRVLLRWWRFFPRTIFEKVIDTFVHVCTVLNTVWERCRRAGDKNAHAHQSGQSEAAHHFPPVNVLGLMDTHRTDSRSYFFAPFGDADVASRRMVNSNLVSPARRAAAAAFLN